MFGVMVVLVSYWVQHDIRWRADWSNYAPPVQYDLKQMPGLVVITANASLGAKILWGDNDVVLDTHTHSSWSDGGLNIEQLLAYELSQGFNAVVVSDHQNVRPGLLAQMYAEETYGNDKLVVIPGQEYTCCRLHMNFYNLNETIEVPRNYPTDIELQDAIRRVHELGGLVVVNHLPWSWAPEGGQFGAPRMQQHPSREQLRDWGVDGFEVVSGGTFDYPTYRFCLENNLIMVTGTDTHGPWGTYAWTVVSLATGVERTPHNILQAVKEQRVQLIYKPEGLIPISQRDNIIGYPRSTQFLTPLLLLGDIFPKTFSVNKGMYSFVDGFCHTTRVQLYPVVMFAIVMWVVIAYVWWKAFNLVLFIAMRHILIPCYKKVRYSRSRITDVPDLERA
jgi:hypothetical protein